MRNVYLRIILLFLILVLKVKPSSAQDLVDYVEPRGYSIGMTFGMSDLWGDIGTMSIVDHYNNNKYWNNLHAMGGLYVRYAASPSIAFRLSANYGTLYANDNWNYSKAQKASSINDDAVQRYIRNLDVHNNIFEASFLIEFTPLRLNMEKKIAQKHFQPYLIAGATYFHMNPRGTYTERSTGKSYLVDLYDYDLEGEGFGFKGAPKHWDKWNVAVPLGLGVRWDMGKRLMLGLEYQYRLTFTDYLDGVSTIYVDPKIFDGEGSQKAYIAKDLYDKSWQINPAYTHKPGDARGNPAVNDGYSTISLNFLFKVKPKRAPWFLK